MQDFDKLWDYNNPTKTAAKFKDILDKIESEQNTSYLAQLYTQLARTQGLQAKWDDAFDYLSKAKSLLLSSDNITHVRYLLELGRTYNSSGKRSKAYDLFLEAWDLGRKIRADGYATDAGHMLAIASDTPEKILEWNLKTIEFVKASDQAEAHKWLGSLYNNLGWTYFNDGDQTKALEIFELALIERKRQDKDENIRIAKWCIARANREIGQVDEALAIQLDLLTTYEQLGNPSMFVFEELAHCYTLKNEQDKAAPYAKQAYDLLSQDDWYVKNEPTRLQALKDIF